ncbi:MAG: type 2 lantipeptide synthetase LanM, partial [Gemmatimonadaceae bacterium]|nr:type 2 lantipeptide synthetase LanM [Gloeobacterales cyanobacterium ES-bin-141]
MQRLTTLTMPSEGPTFEAKALLKGLNERLAHLVERALVLEMHLGASRGKLHGDTPTERYSRFMSDCCRPRSALDLMKEYPVLARLLIEEVDTWVESSVEFGARLLADWPELQVLTGEVTIGTLTHLERTGDRHSKRCTLIATFASGLRLVYKPRSLAVDTHFQAALDWLNCCGWSPAFRTLWVLERESYGWVEFVDWQPCCSEAEVRRFYQRAGGYLALLYILGGTDFYYENVVATGEHPVLVDLEGLLQPIWPGEVSGAEARLKAAQWTSVLRLGLLPCRVVAEDGTEAVDISALSAEPGALLPKAKPHWQEPGTDRMRLLWLRSGRIGHSHRPRLDDALPSAAKYKPQILAGFDVAYRLLAERREEWLAPGGILDRFALAEVRVLCRPTWTYARTLGESLAPNRLRCERGRGDFLAQLGRLELPSAEDLLRCELSDLDRGDIPRFVAHPASRDLWGSDLHLKDFFTLSGLSAAATRLQGLNEADRQRQRWLVEASLLTPRRERCRVLSDGPTVDWEALMAAALAIGERLEREAVLGNEDATWWVAVPRPR